MTAACPHSWQRHDRLLQPVVRAAVGPEPPQLHREARGRDATVSTAAPSHEYTQVKSSQVKPILVLYLLLLAQLHLLQVLLLPAKLLRRVRSCGRHVGDPDGLREVCDEVHRPRGPAGVEELLVRGDEDLCLASLTDDF